MTEFPTAADGEVVAVVDGAVATLWLNRPDKRNAVTHAMWHGIADALPPLATDPVVRVLVVRGVGDHFCAGADIGELTSIDRGLYQAGTRRAEEGLATFPKPTVAQVSGSCVGGGAEIAIACDLRFADTTAVFGITPARLGLSYPPFAVERAVRLLGPSATKHLLYSAELVDHERALRIGLVDEVHPPGALGARVAAFTTLLATERSALTQQASKALVEAVVVEGAIPPDLARRWADEVAAGPDLPEGVAAFAERRPPRFRWAAPRQP